MKRLKNIEDKSEEQIKAIKNKFGIKLQVDSFNEDLSSKAVALVKKIKDIEDNADFNKLISTGGNKKDYGFKNLKTLEKLIKDIYKGNVAIDKVEIKKMKRLKWLVN